MMKHALSILTLSFSVVSCSGLIAPPSGASGGGGVGGTGAPSGAGVAGSTAVAGGPGTSGAAGTGSATGAAGTGAGAAGTGAGAAGTGAGAAGAAGTGASACGPGAIPSDVAAVISAKCVACHGSPPIQGVPSSLTTYAALTAPATTDPSKSVAAVALARLQSKTMPMPPAPLPAASAADVAAFQAWVSAGTPAATCPDGGAPADGGGIADPYATPVVCTSKTMWTRGNSGSSSMDPGQACIACHDKSGGEAPLFAVGGTVYPTAHEPDNCNGGAIAAMSQVVITGADGRSFTLVPNSSGNFNYRGTIAKPYSAKVVYMGRERAMIAKQTSGDCNGCHTEMGAMMAPGRIMLP
jgi:cytochrome c553